MIFRKGFLINPLGMQILKMVLGTKIEAPSQKSCPGVRNLLCTIFFGTPCTVCKVSVDGGPTDDNAVN